MTKTMSNPSDVMVLPIAEYRVNGFAALHAKFGAGAPPPLQMNSCK